MVSTRLFDGASLIPNRKYQTCLIFAVQCQAASDGSPAVADEKERTGKCQQMDVAYFLCTRLFTAPLLSSRLGFHQILFVLQDCLKLKMLIVLCSCFSSLPVAGSTTQQFSTEQVVRDGRSGTDTKIKHGFTGVPVYTPLSRETASCKNTLN